MLSHEQMQIGLMLLAVAIWCVLILYKERFVVIKRIVFAVITIAALISLVGTMAVIGPIGTAGFLICGLIYMAMSNGGD